MSPGAAEPRVPPWGDSVDASGLLGASAAARARVLLSHPSRVAGILWTAGAVAVASVLPLRHWPQSSLLALLVPAGIATICAGLRLTIGPRLPRWSLEVDVGLGSLLVSVIAAAGASEHVGMANLYLLLAFFAVLYLPLRAALAQIGAAGAAYAAVLALGPRSAEPPVLAWLAVFGTAAILGVVVLGLVTVLRVAATEDPLTGLANRRRWDERLDEELERSRRTGAALSVAMVDLDDFKAVNDSLGHHAGDCLLQEIARAWQAAVRGGGDFVARVGGDEFGVLALGSDATGILRLARRLDDALPEGIVASIGVATWDGGENASDLLRRADLAMYQTKRRHRRGEGIHHAGPARSRSPAESRAGLGSG